MSKFKRSYNGGQFTADIEDFAGKTEQRMLAVLRISVGDVIDNAQLAVAKGGRMRVDTGFLRASGQASLNGMPQGPSRGEKTEPNSYAYNSNNVTVKLGELKLGGTFYFGWTAAYARYREIYDGFLEGATQHWGRIVAFNTDTMRQRIK